MRGVASWSLLSLMLVTLGVQSETRECEELRQFTFSWPFSESCEMQPRGGTTRGASVQLDSRPSAEWKALQDKSLSSFQRDRKAILAMAGGYRTSFDFLETIGYVPGFKPAKPYQSWGTELVLVAEDRGDFISLQHIMVMYFSDENGKISGPMVMKHWRQDWQYQASRFMAYDGNQRWSLHSLEPAQTEGSWAQTVFQVDDSPRYGGYGRWQHLPNFSTWVSNESWRPLPRREYSVRDDYQVLIGSNRQTILPSGWVHEQENYKVRLDDKAGIAADMPYIAKELGVNRYEKIVSFDFSAGREYWQYSGNFWSDVTDFWAQKLAVDGLVSFQTRVNGQLMFQPLFDYAEQLVENKEVYDPQDGREFIQQTLEPYLQ